MYEPLLMRTRSAPTARLGIPKVGLLVLLALSVLHIGECRAQAPSRTVSGGVQAGFPSGVTFRLATPSRAWDLDLAWNLDRFLLAEGHVVLARGPAPALPGEVRYELGPGGALQLRRGTMVVGASTHLGLELPLGRTALFARLRPRLELFPSTRPRLGAGLGVRIRP